jgi:hypothetical protein
MPATTSAPSFVDPHRLYSHRGMIAASGLSQTRLREASRRGINCRRLWVGKRAFYRGADVISFIEALAADEITRNAANDDMEVST